MTTLSADQLRKVEFMDDESEKQGKPQSVLDIKPVQSKKELRVEVEDLRSWLAAGVLTKTAFIFLMLLIEFNGDVNVDIKSLADSLRFTVSIDDNRFKSITFTEEEVIEAIAKLNKKGALTIKQTAIQLSLHL